MEFEQEIELLVADGETYLEALTFYASQYELDDAAVVHLLKSAKPIMMKLKAECKQLSLLSDETRDRSLERVI